MSGADRLRNVMDMTATTSSTPLPRHRELSPVGAALLAIAGNILVVAIAAASVVGVAIAAVAVFVPQLLAAL